MKKSILPSKTKDAKLIPWQKIAPKGIFNLEKNSRAGVVIDKAGTPQMFIFDTNALLDVLSEIDEALVDKLTTKDYHSKKYNPAGWLIDEVESSLPVNPNYVKTLKSAIDEANKKGWIPFEQIKNNLMFK